MEYRELGRTGLKVSVLGLGGSSLGGVFGDVVESEAIRTVQVAIDLGINFIDVAPYYGLTWAETVLGKALKTIDRQRYYVATKVGRYGDADFDFSAQRVIASVDASLRRLGLDYVDLIQCHDIEYGSLDQVVEETLPALRAVCAQGKARFIGITGLPLKIFRQVLGRTDVDTVLSYCHYNLYDTTLADLAPFLKEKQVGVMSASPLAMGLLTIQGTPAWHPAPADMKAFCAQVVADLRDHGVDITRLAIEFSVANADIAVTLVGAAEPALIEKNVKWAESRPDAALLAEVQARFAPIRNRTWASGRPENN